MAPAPVASPPVTPAALVAHLQRSVGNARVSRMLDRFAQAQVSATPATTSAPSPAVPANVAAWLADHPTGNAKVATWLLAGETHGFITFRADGRLQMAALAAGKDEVLASVGERADVKPHKIDTRRALGLLTILEGLTRSRADRWTANPTQPKSPVQTGDLIRDLTTSIGDAHASGASADLFSGFDWDGSKGPAQVVEVLQDLPKGTYTIGLPMQGQFFPEDEYLDKTQKATLAQGGTRTPDSIVYYSTKLWRSTYDASLGPKYPWKDERLDGLVVTRLQSAALKSAITALTGSGTTLNVMPDQNDHIHITRH